MNGGERVLALLALAVLLALIGGVLYALWLIGAETVRLLAMVLLAGSLLIGLVWAAQFPIRAWRSNIQPERHIYHEKVREIHHLPVPDPRATPSTPALPQPPAEPAYPELMRAAFLAGLLDGPTGTSCRWDEEAADDDRAELSSGGPACMRPYRMVGPTERPCCACTSNSCPLQGGCCWLVITPPGRGYRLHVARAQDRPCADQDCR